MEVSPLTNDLIDPTTWTRVMAGEKGVVVHLGGGSHRLATVQGVGLDTPNRASLYTLTREDPT